MNADKSIVTGIFLAAVASFACAPAQAGETPYNQGSGSSARATPEMYYFCLAGIGGSSSHLYITPVMRETWPYDVKGIFIQTTVDPQWRQAIKGQLTPLNAHCIESPQADATRIRQQYIDQEGRGTIVNIDWHYGQTGPATPKA